MPKVTWDELSEIRHSVANNIEKLYKLEAQIRDFYRTANTDFCVQECLKTLLKIRDGLTTSISELDGLTLKHENEEV